MEHHDFKIGEAFTTGHALFRCTDVGTRTVIAIRLDKADVVSRSGSHETRTVIDPRRDPHWLSGPPYALAEIVFDEDDLLSCHPVAEEGIIDWAPTDE